MSAVKDQINALKRNALKKVEEVEILKGHGVPFGCLDQATNKIADLVSNSGAYQNAKAAFIDGSKAASQKAKDFLKNILPEDLPDGWSLNDVKNIMSKLDVFDASMDKFKEWTNHLSGLSNIPGMPSMQSLLSTCSDMQKYFSCAGVELPKSQEQAQQVFGSILLDQATTDSTEQYINSIERLMYNGSTPNDILNELERNQMIYDTSIYRDQQSIADFSKTLINQNTALSITGMNAYDSSFNLLKDTIASPELKQLMTK